MKKARRFKQTSLAGLERAPKLGSTRRRKRKSTKRKPASGRTDYNTPAPVLEALASFGSIACDPCWNARSLVRARITYTIEQDGLAQQWPDTPGRSFIYVNPPYTTEPDHPHSTLRAWAAAINANAHAGRELVSLVAASTETAAFRELTARAQCVAFFRARLKYHGERNAAFFASALVYHGARAGDFERALAPLANTWHIRPSLTRADVQTARAAVLSELAIVRALVAQRAHPSDILEALRECAHVVQFTTAQAQANEQHALAALAAFAFEGDDARAVYQSVIEWHNGRPHAQLEIRERERVLANLGQLPRSRRANLTHKDG